MQETSAQEDTVIQRLADIEANGDSFSIANSGGSQWSSIAEEKGIALKGKSYRQLFRAINVNLTDQTVVFYFDKFSFIHSRYRYLR